MTQSIKGINGPIVGKFRLAAITGLTTGMGANAPIFSARFAPASAAGAASVFRAALVDIRLKAQILTPFTSANEVSAQAFIARSFTASDTGGTSILPASLNNMLESFADSGYTSSFTDIRVAAATALAAGTRTLDSTPFLHLPVAQIQAAASANQPYSEADYSPYSDQRFTLVLRGAEGGTAANAEGIVVTTPVAQGAAGVVRYTVEIEWYEFNGAIYTAQGLG